MAIWFERHSKENVPRMLAQTIVFEQSERSNHNANFSKILIKSLTDL